jgi:hypothetical protein
MNKPEYSHRYRDKNRDKLREMWRKRYYSDPERNKRHAEQRKNTDKNKARNKLHHEVEAGRIIKPILCENCGTESILHGHHVDYNKPLEVKWLCSFCHGLEHRIYSETLEAT